MLKKLISAAEFNAVADIAKTNCFAFMAGLTEPDGLYDLPRTDPDECKLTIEVAFKWRCEYHGIKVRQVSSLEEASGRNAYIVFGWYRYGDFHCVRKNPDGTFEHKPDRKEPATAIDFRDILEEYPEGYKVFVDEAED